MEKDKELFPCDLLREEITRSRRENIAQPGGLRLTGHLLCLARYLCSKTVVPALVLYVLMGAPFFIQVGFTAAISALLAELACWRVCMALSRRRLRTTRMRVTEQAARDASEPPES